MIYTAQELNNYFDAGLQLVGQDENGELEFVGEDHNWTAHQWLEDGVSRSEVHGYLVTQS